MQKISLQKFSHPYQAHYSEATTLEKKKILNFRIGNTNKLLQFISNYLSRGYMSMLTIKYTLFV